MGKKGKKYYGRRGDPATKESRANPANRNASQPRRDAKDMTASELQQLSLDAATAFFDERVDTTPGQEPRLIGALAGDPSLEDLVWFHRAGSHHVDTLWILILGQVKEAFQLMNFVAFPADEQDRTEKTMAERVPKLAEWNAILRASKRMITKKGRGLALPPLLTDQSIELRQEKKRTRRLCAWCGAAGSLDAEAFSVCDGCDTMRYCGERCQTSAWDHSHKFACYAISIQRGGRKPTMEQLRELARRWNHYFVDASITVSEIMARLDEVSRDKVNHGMWLSQQEGFF